ncbi:phosphatidylinositol 4-phosphate 3-kinase C2 domain-containing subunit alpha-like [Saccostrea echinata]|uniref:phosphatidylinositol 4-phosphate 3-kinase C2 domain-containing subunit alpha-like n=1 Tax=Saccostrea echinata TaxID=191078 RepID=UPI002A7F5AA8|nr:phosphatidylinositol 4-phosphate 3-kinase C2 domain-containing subunit alpha-like [Saccostrea echinata]
MQFNPPPGQNNIGYPQQVPARQGGGIGAPHQSNHQRSSDHGNFFPHHSLAPPGIGWNIPGPDQQQSPWGQRSVSPCLNQTNPFKDNFVLNNTPSSASSSAQNISRKSATQSQRHLPTRLKTSSKDTGNSSPLITLSPENTLQRNMDGKVKTSTYSMDLEGLDFSVSSSNLGSQKPLSSSAEEMSTSTQKSAYPDYSHVFNEIRREQNVNNVAQLNSCYPKTQTGTSGVNYGWNVSYLSGDNHQNSVNKLEPSWQGMSTGIQSKSQFSGYQSTFRSNWTYQSPRPTYNAWGYNPNFIMPAASPTLFPSLSQVSSSSDFDDLRFRKEEDTEEEESDIFGDDFVPQRDFVEENQSRSRTSSDLIEFEEPEEKEYMSLDLFDPLYSRTRRESIIYRRNSISGENDVSKSTESNVDFSELERPQSGLYPTIPEEAKDLENSQESVYRPDRSDTLSSTDALEQFLRSSFVAPVEETKPDIPERPPSILPRAASTHEGPYEKLHKRVFVDEESESFSQMVSKLKSKFSSKDTTVNRGYVVSAFCEKHQPSMSVKITIHSDYSVDPVIFTCDVHSNVEHVIGNVLYNHLQSEGCSADDFVLKVYDKTEYLLNDHPLSEYEYVHNCLKLDKDIRFIMLRKQDIPLPFLRTADDDDQFLVFPKDYVSASEGVVSQTQLETLMNTFSKELESLMDHILKNSIGQIHTTGLSQSVKAICTILANIQTIEVTRCLKRAEDIFQQMLENQKQQSEGSSYRGTQAAISIATHSSLVQEMQEMLEQLMKAVNQLIKMYCSAFHTDFMLGSPVKKNWNEKYVTKVEDDFIIHIATAHRIPTEWIQRYDEYKVVCSLHHGSRKIGDDVVSQTTTNQKDLCDLLNWDQWLSFKDVSVSKLPRETRLCVTLCGMKGMQNTQNNEAAKVLMALGGVTMQLYNQKGYLIQGSQLVPLKMNMPADPFSPYCSVLDKDTVLMQINLPDFGENIVFPDILPKSGSERKSFQQLLPEIQDIVDGVLEKDCISSCQADELEILWRYRHYLYEHPQLLPWILQGSKEWDYYQLADISGLLRDWTVLDPMQALELLLPQFPDSRVREFAVNCLHKIKSDEIVDFLPQLIQALKYESYHASPLAWLLLERASTSVRFAHQLFWLLKGTAAQDTTYKRRYELMFVALINVAGDLLYQEFRKQEVMVKILTTIGEKVQVAKDKENTLKRESQHLQEFFDERGSCLLPYDPGLCVTGVDLKSCSYFTSNAVPLKLVFRNPNIRADPVYVMFKVGDDLRQDMLTMQMIKIMDRLWLKAGLDLKIITFACLATGPKKGLVELITESETLRKIQVQAGVTGSFKDRPIKEWLQGHNPTELEYQKAVDNFTRSCAGYCVATYVLGVCDRHNDNIMLKQSGHMFHIDFNKFLGDAQMFGNFKRDRVPFVLTSDMAFVINNGEKHSDKFQLFIDLCCQGFNILRRNANLFLNLFALVYVNIRDQINIGDQLSRSGIPGVTEGAARYIQRALLPGHTEAQATAMFTRMIEDSLKSVFTQFNFFIHNLAQMKFSSHQEGALLSFVPKTYSINTDGKIENVVVHSYQKRYDPERHYIFIFKVERVNQKVPMYVFRHYSEFLEFRNKVMDLFPLTSWPPPLSKFQMGRSHVKKLAEARKQEMDRFVHELWRKAPEVCESDIVYTFFHPLLRDEQEAQKARLNIPKLKENHVELVPQRSQFGMVKLSIHHRKNILHIMIMHAKDLPATSELPSPYVKTYLLPDPEKETKRKTKIIKHSTHPTYNEVIEYRMSLDELKQKILQVSVWDHDVLKENNLLGAVYIKLREMDVSKEVPKWYNLEKIQITNSSIA